MAKSSTPFSFKYYYYVGHDWSNNESPKAFEGYNTLKELAQSHGYKNNKQAVKDSEYVFTAEEYKDFLGLNSANQSLEPAPYDWLLFCD